MATATKAKSVTRAVTIELPEDLLVAAEARGIHLANVFARALKDRIEMCDAGARMSAALLELEPPITRDEIDDEIAAWKVERARERERADRR